MSFVQYLQAVRESAQPSRRTRLTGVSTFSCGGSMPVGVGTEAVWRLCSCDSCILYEEGVVEFSQATTGGCSGNLLHACTPISAWVAGRGRFPWC